MRIGLVDHMDEILRDALVIQDPEALPGPPRAALMKYREDQLVQPTVEGPATAQ